MALLEINSLTYSYPQSSHLALDHINLRVEAGEMLIILGGSGSGKSTLLRALCRLIPDFYGGTLNGAIEVAGRSLLELSQHELVQTVGMVYENPENQLVMTSVEQELSFGLENLALPFQTGYQRLAEVAEALGLTPWLKQSVATLSGGQKQKTALGAVMAMRPGILLLDEPSSRLDPVASEELFQVLRRLNEDNGLTIIMAEQRLERCYHLADRVLHMARGRVIQDGTPEVAARWASSQNSPFVPPIPELFARANRQEIPLTVKEARKTLGDISPAVERPCLVKAVEADRPILSIKGLSFNYPGAAPLLKQINFNLPRQQIIALMGANGAGKSTLGKIIMGLLKPQTGVIKIDDVPMKGDKTADIARRIGYLPQETASYFFLPTVEQEIEFNQRHLGASTPEWLEMIADWFALSEIGEKHPRDLSRGEQQQAALACVLLPKPEIIILDEPTQGLEPNARLKLGTILRNLVNQGTSILLITHDIEFAAEYAHQAAFLQQGVLIGQGDTHDMLSGHTFYSPQINRLMGGTIIKKQEALDCLQAAAQPAANPLVVNSAEGSRR